MTALVIAVTVAMGTLASTATAFAPNPGYGSLLVTRHADADAGLKRSVVTYGTSRSKKEFSSINRTGKGQSTSSGSDKGGMGVTGGKAKESLNQMTSLKSLPVPEADEAMTSILSMCDEEVRDVKKIKMLCNQAGDYAVDGSWSVTAAGMKGDYQLVFVTSDEALCAVGSGLHKVFATKMEDLFISFGPKYMQAESGAFGLETAEILRVFGPFPNIRNTFAGDFACGDGGSVVLSYDTMVNGLSQKIKAPDGKDTRRMKGRIPYANSAGLIYIPNEAQGEGGEVDNAPLLVFQRLRKGELDLKFKELRVDVDRDAAIQEANMSNNKAQANNGNDNDGDSGFKIPNPFGGNKD